MIKIERSSRLVLIEGPDGAGKSSLAKSYALRTGARYVHLGPFPRVGKNLARLYVEALMPAVLGDHDIVMDRCWLSELPYGQVLREGEDRIGPARRRLLDRLAARCRTSVILAAPPREVAVQNFLKRRDSELPQTREQIETLYDLYQGIRGWTSLPVSIHDYSSPDRSIFVDDIASLPSTSPHPVSVPTAGFLEAPIALIGDTFSSHDDRDPLYQWPFGSLSGAGCSHWLANELEEKGVPESRLFWANSSDLGSSLVESLAGKAVVALGSRAFDRLKEAGVSPAAHFLHPQGWKRFHFNEPYELTNHVKESLCAEAAG